MNESVTIFAPATVANVACGYDTLGFCLDKIGDIMHVRRIEEKGIYIRKIEGYDLPKEPEQNVATISAMAMYEDADPDFGFEIDIIKKIQPGSGIGSSSASAVGSVFGMNQLLGNPYNLLQLTEFAIEGEMFASKSRHADNLAPAMFGGFTLVRSTSPLEIIELPTPDDLYAVIVHPMIQIKTAEARGLLPEKVDIKNAVTQWANLGSLVHALHVSDYELLGRALEDVIIEPHRKQLIPLYDSAKASAIRNGALGCNISGSGPSIFALCKGEANAISIEKGFRDVYSKSSIGFETFHSKVGVEGVRIIQDS